MSVDKIVAALTAEDPSLRSGAATLLVDHVLARPLAELVDADTVAEVTLMAFTEASLERVMQGHAAPGFAQFRTEVMQGDETVGDAVPPDLHGPMLDVIGQPDGPQGRWLVGALPPGQLVDLLAPVFQDVLLGFIAKVPGAAGVAGGGEGGGGGPSGTGGGGVMGMLGAAGRNRAGRLLDVGRSVVGGLGLESVLKPVAQDFSRAAVSAFQQSLRKRLRSSEGRELLLQLQQGVFEHVMAVKLSDIDADLERIAIADVLALVPPLVAHNLGRELGQTALRSQVRRYYEVEGARPLSALLAQWGVEERVRGIAVERAETLSQGLFASEGFAAWLSQVLAAAGV